MIGTKQSNPGWGGDDESNMKRASGKSDAFKTYDGMLMRTVPLKLSSLDFRAQLIRFPE